MRQASIVFVLLLSSSSLAAQNSTGNNPAVLVKPPFARSCPVELSVSRIPDGAIVMTNGASVPHSQGLNLTFANPQAQIVSADLIVHFYSAAVHAIPAAPSASSGAALTESFHLSGSGGDPVLHSNIWSRHTAVINWVELTRLGYADGTSWQASTARQCGAAPSLYVLVDSAR